MRKRKRSKSDGKLLFIGMLIFSIFLVVLLNFGIFKIFRSNTFRVDSRVDKIAEKQVYDTGDRKTVAWLRVQGTNIDYPVLYAPDYDFSYEIDDFAWTEADYKKLNNIIYVSGHNIKNQSRNPVINGENHTRFEQLMGFTYYDFAKENQFIQYTINGKNYVYKIYSVAYQKMSDLDVFNKGEYDYDNMRIFIDNTLDKSIYKYDVDVNENDKIISLSTCTAMYDKFDNVQFTVNARLLRNGEKIQLSKIEKTESYQEIEKIMKGGNSYDEA